jgi:branched-chain amino acid aminotransferase
VWAPVSWRILYLRKNMKKPFIKQKVFSRPFLGKPGAAPSSRGAVLPLDSLNRIACFETLRAYQGKVLCLSEHLDRLSDSCEGVGRRLPLKPGVLARWVQNALKESAFSDARLRLSVHWGKEREDSLLLMIWEFKRHPEVWYREGVKLSTVVTKRWTLRAQDPQIKSSMFLSGVMAVLDQGGHAAHELVFLNQDGAVAEGTVSNLFMIKGKRLLTPAVSSGILRGVTRRITLELAIKRNIEVIETVLSRHDIYNADECFMTNTTSEVLPVISLDGRQIGDGRPGVMTRALGKDFKQYVRKTLGIK